MTLLKLKAKIYQYTGVYLAQKEEMIASEAYTPDPTYPGNIADDFHIYKGSWQADNGFMRGMSPLWIQITKHRLYKNPVRLRLYKVLSFIIMFYQQAKEDISEIY